MRTEHDHRMIRSNRSGSGELFTFGLFLTICVSTVVSFVVGLAIGAASMRCDIVEVEDEVSLQKGQDHRCICCCCITARNRDDHHATGKRK